VEGSNRSAPASAKRCLRSACALTHQTGSLQMRGTAPQDSASAGRSLVACGRSHKPSARRKRCSEDKATVGLQPPGRLHRGWWRSPSRPVGIGVCGASPCQGRNHPGPAGPKAHSELSGLGTTHKSQAIPAALRPLKNGRLHQQRFVANEPLQPAGCHPGDRSTARNKTGLKTSTRGGNGRQGVWWPVRRSV